MKVFISYRREDSQVTAGRLAQFLDGVPVVSAVFLDVDDIAVGEDFERRIADRIGGASHVLVLIGRHWQGPSDASGRTRLFDVHDPVRQELRLALAGRSRVVPILVDGSPMPGSAELPDELQCFAKLNAFALRTAHFDADLDDLLDVLQGRRKGRGSRWRAAPLTPPQAVARAVAGLAGGALAVLGLGLLNRWVGGVCYDLVCRLQKTLDIAAEDDALALLSAIAIAVLALAAIVPFVPRLLALRRRSRSK